MQYCRRLFAEDADRVALELLQGYPNATIDSNQALWEVAQVAKTDQALLEELSAGAGIESLREHLDFDELFRKFLEEYGSRAHELQIGAPTWRERPDIPLSLVVAMARSDSPSPLEALREAERRRESLVAQMCSLVAKQPGEPAGLLQAHAQASAYIPVREDRSLWQLRSYGELRLALLRIGSRLVAEGGIESAEEILFLLPDEIDGNATDLRKSVNERRQEWLIWSRVRPPQLIGASPGASVANTLTGSAFQAAEISRGVIQGIPASRGEKTGVARVITAPEEAYRLADGEILVCQTTTAPWTPLFGVAGAVVTEAGGLLMHTGIIAREYGIPCVVAARGAMSRIRDGTEITVDGTSGVVTFSETQ